MSPRRGPAPRPAVVAAVVAGASAGPTRPGWLALGLLLLTLAGLGPRLVWLWPPTSGVIQAPYDDEGVYVMAAQLLRQGLWPYRDYFFAHPPLGVLTVLPAVSLAYTPWGSGLSFGLARLLMVGLGTLTIPLVGLAAARLWGPAGGVVAAGLLAFDPASVANSRHILLEVPMTLLVAAGLWSSVGDPARASPRTGLLAGLAALVKVQALTFALAQAVTLAARRRWRALAGLLGGLGLAASLLAVMALVVGPDRLVRQVVLFQLLRPGDGLATIGERLGALLAPGGLLLGLSGAALGLTVGWLAGPGRRVGAWAPVALWVGLGLASFLLSRSFYQHYVSQLMPGLAVLAGGLGAGGWRLGGEGRRWAAGVALLGLAGLAAVGLAPVVAPRPDDTFARVARYVNDALPPDRPAMTTDAQFNYLAGRPLPASGGYLVDSYGTLVYTGLGLADGPLAAAALAAWTGRAGASVHDIMWRPAAQALLRQQMAESDLVVIHAVGRGRLTPETLAGLAREFRLVESNRRYDIYRRTP